MNKVNRLKRSFHKKLRNQIVTMGKETNITATAVIRATTFLITVWNLRLSF